MFWFTMGTGFASSADGPPAAREQCVASTSLVEFQAAARAGEQAFANIDLPALTHAREEALSTIPCIGERVTTDVAADFHRMMAMAAFTAGNESLVLAEFRAARRLKPGYEIPPNVAPTGHPLVNLYERAVESADADEELEAVIPPIDGTVAVDGTQGGLRVRGLSAIVQTFDASAQLSATEYLLPQDPTPQYGPIPLEIEQQKRRRRGLLAATGASAALASGLYAGALMGERQFKNPSGNLPNPRQTQANNNAVFWSSVGVGSIALGLGAFTTITW
ncbi:MAG: hypothetical protein CL927_08910 [Deltaproteobacteria bacterium]|nr:hypothetical protein [Deltaproteobacteria bacterium]HCH64468.1 hypothetical protein [Deltaproteobacteria bacterium]